MISVVFASLLATTSASVPTPVQPLAGLFTADDYPMEAARESQEGDVGFAVDVDAAGRITSCLITASSNSPALDAATCQLITTRATFKPGRDKRGRKVAGQYRNTIWWRLPEDERALKSWSQTLRMTIAGNGELLACAMSASGSGFPTQKDGCVDLQQMPPQARLALRSSPEPEPIAVVFQTTFSLDGDDFPADYENTDVRLVNMIMTSFDIDADGAVQNCKVVRAEGILGAQNDPCGPVSGLKFDVAITDKIKPFPRKASFMEAAGVRQNGAATSDAQAGQAR